MRVLRREHEPHGWRRAHGLFGGMIVALLWAAAPVLGQQPAEALTLEDAIEYARAHSPAYGQVLNDLAVADWRQRAGWAAFLPAVSLSAGTGGGRSTTVTGQTDAGEPYRLPAPLEFESSSSNQGVGLNFTLFEGGARFQELSQGRAQARETRARVDAQAVALDAQIAQLYWQAVQRQQRIAVEEDLLAAAIEQRDAIERMVRVAAAGPEEVLGAEVDVAERELSLEQARSEARKARLMLLEAMGAPLAEDVELVSPPPDVEDPAALNVDALVERAVRAHPDVVAAEAAVQAAEDGADAARSRRWPTLSASANWGRSMSLSSNEALFEPDPQNRAFSFNLSASLPLFNRFQTSLAVAQTSAAADDAVAQARAQRLLVEREVRSAVIDLRNAYSALALARRSAELSAERVELARERYRLGAMSFTELQSVINQAAQAELAALDARFAYVQARVTLEERTGGGIAS